MQKTEDLLEGMVRSNKYNIATLTHFLIKNGLATEQEFIDQEVWFTQQFNQLKVIAHEAARQRETSDAPNKVQFTDEQSRQLEKIIVGINNRMFCKDD